jgi:hypothetical protein
MSFVDKNLANIKIGFDGESTVREWLKRKDYKFMQVDVMFKKDGKWFLGEIKTQEKYLSPPFDGHGLPKWQIDARIAFYKQTGIEPILFVNCLTDKVLYCNSILKLMETDHFYTKGNSPRVIFNIIHFVKIKI